MVPDFSSTEHIVQGESLEAAFENLVEHDFNDTPKEEHQVNAYVCCLKLKFEVTFDSAMLWSTAFHAGPAAWRESSSQEIMQRIIDRRNQ